MRVLLRNAKTRKFLQAGYGRRWTKNPRLARDFRTGWRATYHAFMIVGGNLVIDYEFGDERYNLHIPIVRRSEGN
jgi:hypothetical protein